MEKEPSNNGMSVLRALTEALPDPLSAYVGNRGQGIIEYDLPAGHAIGFCLFANNAVSVQRAFLSAGATFPPHSHDANEYVLIYKGRGKSISEKGERVILEGECFHATPRERHTFMAIEDTWLIAITIPADKEGYPTDARAGK